MLRSGPAVSRIELGGKVDYCLRALMDKSWIKADNFRNTSNKGRYLYVLTPNGVEVRARLTKAFLQRKLRACEELAAEIERLRQEVGDEYAAVLALIRRQSAAKYFRSLAFQYGCTPGLIPLSFFWLQGWFYQSRFLIQRLRHYVIMLIRIITTISMS